MKTAWMVLAVVGVLAWSASWVSACDTCGCKGKATTEAAEAPKADVPACCKAAADKGEKCAACAAKAAACKADCKAECCKAAAAKGEVCKVCADKGCKGAKAAATTTAGTTCSAAKGPCGAAAGAAATTAGTTCGAAKGACGAAKDVK